MNAEQADVLRELERLGVEIDGLRAALRRLVLAADADRRAIERALHDGMHQRLVALAIDLQLAMQAVGSDPTAVMTRLEEMGRDVDSALDQTALLAQRIYPASLAAKGFAALLRSSAAAAGVPASVSVADGLNYPPEVGMTLYLCWLDTLARGSSDTGVAISVREGEDAITFEVTANGARSDADLARMRDRVQALGGQLTVGSEPGSAVRIAGSLPTSP